MQLFSEERLSLIAWFLLLAISLVVTFRRRSKSAETVFLALYFWAFFYTVFSAYLVSYRYAVLVPHIFRTGFPVSTLIMPLSYMYMQMSLYERNPKWKDLLHLLPFLVFVADLVPFYLLSAETKADLIRTLSKKELTIGVSQGLFMPTYGHSLIRYGMVLVYCLLQFRMLWKKAAEGNDKLFLSWLQTMNYSQLTFSVLPLVSVLVLGIDTYAPAAVLGGVIVALVQGYYLLFHPEILYGIPVKEPEPDGEKKREGSAERNEYYTEEVLEGAGAIIEKYMLEKKPYLRGKFKVQELSEATGVSVHVISAYVNRKKGMNFFGYVNQFRINECMDKLTAGEHEQKTLEALAEECGFQNRTTFIRVFKQVTGKTPSDYLNALTHGLPVSDGKVRQG